MSLLPKPIREAVYWVNAQGKFGRGIIEAASFCFICGVKVLGIKPWQDLAALTVTSDKHKFIYIGIPKIATRTFRDILVTQNGEALGTKWTEKPGAFMEARKNHPDYFTFGFVRNPWSRALSCYNSKINNAVLGKQARIMSFYKGLSPKMSFEDFVEWLCGAEGRDDIADRHWISQYLYMAGDDGQLSCDFVGKYENLEADWETICEKAGIPHTALPHKGWNSTAKSGLTDYRDHYTDKTRDLIAQRYAKDIEVFGYEF